MGNIDPQFALWKLCGGGDQAKWNAIETFLNQGGTLLDIIRGTRDTPTFPASDLPYFDKRIIASNDTVTQTAAASGGKFVVTAASAGSTALNGNHRELWLQTRHNYEDSEIRSIFYSGGTWTDSANRVQQGHVHRAQDLGGGQYRAWVAWHDIITPLPAAINIGVWGGDGTTGGFVQRSTNTPNTTVTARPTYPFTTSSRASNVVSLAIPGSFDIAIGDRVTVTDNATLNTTNAVVTLVFGSVVQFTLAGADGASLGPGIVRRVGPTPSDMPYWLASRVRGRTIQAKVWRIGETEPSWDSAITRTEAVDATAPVPSVGKGYNGVMVGHASGGETVSFGPIIINGTP